MNEGVVLQIHLRLLFPESKNNGKILILYQVYECFVLTNTSLLL